MNNQIYILITTFLLLNVVNCQKKLGKGRAPNTPKPFPLYTPVFNAQVAERRQRYGNMNFFEKDLVDAGQKNQNYVSKDGIKDLPVVPQYRNYVVEILDDSNTLLRSPPPTNEKPFHYTTTSAGTLKPRFQTRYLMEKNFASLLPIGTAPIKSAEFSSANSIFKGSSSFMTVNNASFSSLKLMDSVASDPKLKSIFEPSKGKNSTTILSELLSAFSRKPLSEGSLVASKKGDMQQKPASKTSSGNRFRFPTENEPESKVYKEKDILNKVEKPKVSNQMYKPSSLLSSAGAGAAANKNSELFAMALIKSILSKNLYFKNRTQKNTPYRKLGSLDDEKKIAYNSYKELSLEESVAASSNHSLLELLNPLALVGSYIDFAKKVPKSSNRFINYVFPKIKVPEQNWFDMVGNEIVHKRWRVNFVVAPIPIETVVSVNNDHFGLTIMNNIIERQQMVEVSWEDLIVHEYSMLQSQEVAVGVFKKNVGAYVNVNKRSRGVEVDVMGTDNFAMSVFADLQARDYGARFTVKNVEVLVRHDFDDRWYPDTEVYATEYGARFANVVSVFGGIDIPETKYYFSINLRRFSVRAEREFKGRETVINTSIGRADLNKQFDVQIETNFSDKESSETFFGVGMGRRNVAFVTIGAGLTHLGLPQAVVEVAKPNSSVNFGLRLDSKDKYQYSFTTRVGSTSYTYVTKLHPQNLKIPNVMGISPKVINNFWNRLGINKSS